MLTVDEARELLVDMRDEMRPLVLTFEALDAYYTGMQTLPREPQRLTRTYRALREMSRSNWCRLIVDVITERLSIEKFITAQEKTSDDTCMQHWQRNNLDAMQVPVYTDAGKFGVCYAMAWPSPDRATARITGESPLLVHVRYDDEQPEQATAAIKYWTGRDHYTYATLYDGDGVYRFRASTPDPGSDVVEDGTRYNPRGPDQDPSKWQLRPMEEPFSVNPMGVVPFTAFRTQPNLLGEYESEFASVLPIQDRINKTIFDRMVTQEFAAFPQRWVTGIEIPTDASGNPIEPFDAAVDRIWTSENDATNFGQFPPAALDGYLRSIEADVQALATQSRTPPHYLIAGMGMFPSGESVRATEYGLSRKVQNRQLVYGEAWADVMRLAGLATKDTTLAEDPTVEAVWRNVEARSEGEVVDALLKMSTLGVPEEELWERWGASPEQIKAWRVRLDALEAKEEARQAAQAATSRSTAGPVAPTTPAQAKQAAM